MDYYSFIVDTDSYSGNFEREMTAYVTGQIGECGIGESEANLFHEDYPNMDLSLVMYFKPDEDHGCRRPCAIEITPNRGNDDTGIYAYESVGMYFEDDPCDLIDLLRSRSLEYAKNNNIKITGFRLQYIKTTIELIEL